MDAQLPGVAKGFDLLGLAGEGVVLAVGDGAVVEADLPVGAVDWPVRSSNCILEVIECSYNRRDYGITAAFCPHGLPR